MSAFNRKPGPKGRFGKNYFVTRTGNTVKINRSIGDRIKARKDIKLRSKAAYLATLPKGRVKRFFARLHPKRMYRYWFSRQGGIMALKLVGIGTVASFLLLVGLFAYYRKDLPNLKDISGTNIGGSMRYYDRTGKTLLWEDYDAVKRIPVKSDEMSQHIKDATIAVEDKDFYKHGGFDVRGIMRAGVNNAFGKSGSQQGGSTLTQQLVKLTQNWTKDQTYTRKVKELILSVELERSYTKDEILTGYLNTAPYGGIEYGIEAAARDYFNKSAKDLTLAEASALATIPKSPRFYSPYSTDFDPESFVGRQHYVLELMQQQGMITAAEKDEAKLVDVIASVKPRKPKYDGIKAPWFVLAAKKQLEDKFGTETVQRGGWVVTTTLDLNLQQLAEDQVNKGMTQVRRQGGDTAGFAAEDVTTGQMVALVGGSDFSNPEFGQFNYATSPLPPGSSFKPYDYLALMEQKDNFGAGSVLYDTLGPLEGYPCTNKGRPQNGGNCLQDFDFRTPGPMTLRYALGGSRNIPAVKAMLLAGVDKTIETAEKLGLKSGYNCYTDEKLTKEGQCYASSAIGDGAYLHLDEHVHSYGTISRNGVLIPQTYILKIADAQGKTVDEWKATKGEQVVRQDSAYIVADILSDPNASYFPAGSKPHRYKNWKFSMKTGTTNDTKDGWMMGFSPKYSAGVWVGYHTRQREMSGTMETMTRPIWTGWMQKAHDNEQAFDRPKPAGVQTLPAYVVRTHVGIGSVEPSPATDLFPSWYKQPSKKTGSNRTIDVVSNKLATNCTPERAKKQLNEADATTFSGDTFVGGANANTQENDDVHKCEDAKPSITLTPSCGGGSCTFTATVTQGTHAISSAQFPGTVNFIIDGQTVRTESVGSSPTSVSYTATGSGNKSVTAQVIDSVLYETSDTVTADFGDTASASISLSVSSVAGNLYKFNWNTIPGASSYQICIDTNATPTYVCAAGNPGDNRTVTGSNKKAYILANTGTQSNTESF